LKLILFNKIFGAVSITNESSTAFLSVNTSSAAVGLATGSRLISEEWLIVGFKASLLTSNEGFGSGGSLILFLPLWQTLLNYKSTCIRVWLELNLF
jgi:hypothetical protein